jgi:serine/threonine protein phosphatase PrpC
MNCPHCGVPVEEEGSKFCGDCGGSLEAPSANATTDGGQDKAAVNPLLRCPECGAGPGAIADDGFCSCGTLRRKPLRDHMEVIVTPRFAGVSDIGKKHHQNEDFIALAQARDGAHVMVVCDGVSQSQSPQEGSKIGAETACALVVAQLAATNGNSKEIVRDAIIAAQAAICTVPFHPGLKDKKDRDIDPAQSTIVLVLVQDRKVTLGWAGDSRGYWQSKSGVIQITRDDSWADEQVAAGKMTMEEAMKCPEAHAITNSLGAAADGSNPGIHPTVVTMNLTEPGRLILCSDGFWNYAEDPAVIAKLVAQQPAGTDALTLARALVNYARDTTNGGKDNISVIVRDC